MTNITTLRPGEHFMFKGFEWVCLDPNHPDGGVLAIMATPWAENVKFCPDERYADEKGNWNNYRTSLLHKEVLGLVKVLGTDNLILHKINLVADNGDRAYNTVTFMDDVFILTCDEYRKYRDYIPHYDSLIWTGTPLFCGDKDSDMGFASHVRSMSVSGKLYNSSVCSNNAVAPACILNPKSLNLRKGMAYVEEVSE
nr:MAG TPA: hypothetical protein [Caudoviricetes sp.]